MDLKLNYILFLVLSFVIIFGYTYFFVEPPKQTDKGTQQETAQTTPSDGQAPGTPETEEKTVSPEQQRIEVADKADLPLSPKGTLITVKTPLYEGVIDSAGGRIINWNLGKYKETTQKNSPPVDPLSNSPPAINTVLKVEGRRIPNPIPFELKGETKVRVLDSKREIVLSWTSGDGIEVRRIFEIDPSSYLVTQRFQVKNNTAEPLNETLSIEWYGTILEEPEEEIGKFITRASNEVERLDEFPEKDRVIKGTIKWFGFAGKYFMTTFLPEIGGERRVSVIPVKEEQGLVGAVFSYPGEVIPPGGSSIHSSKVYIGPMNQDILESAGYELDSAIEYGWVGFLARPVLVFLEFINKYVQNYGITIIIATIIIRLIFFPLTVKSMKSMKEMQVKMQDLKPKIEALKEKYSDDKTKQNQELMNLYSSHGVNPLSSLGGCLPLLIQLPVFIALYDVLLYSIDLRHSAFLWIQDLAEPEHLWDIPGTGIPFRFLPLAMGVSWFLSQRMTPMTSTTVGDTMEMQMKLMQFMPLIFMIMFWGLPSGLILYWTVSNILSVGQQLYVNRQVDLPKGGN